MKTKLLLFTVLIINYSLLILPSFAQAPERMNYQGVARNSADNSPLVNQTIALRLSVHSGKPGGPVVYQETQTPSTNQAGLFNIAIGNGSIESGTFAGINWGTLPSSWKWKWTLREEPLTKRLEPRTAFCSLCPLCKDFRLGSPHPKDKPERRKGNYCQRNIT